MSEDDVRRLLAEATPGPWDNTFYCKRDGSPIETIEDIREIVAGSVDYSARTELFGVSLQDADDDGLCTVICYTGNGPNAHNNAALIAAAPTIAAAYIEQAATIARLTDERGRLREALEKIAGEQNVYKGHGNYDTEPACSAEDAQKIARDELSKKCSTLRT